MILDTSGADDDDKDEVSVPVDLHDYFRILRRRWITGTIVALATIALAAAVTLISGLNAIGAIVRGSVVDAVIPIGMASLHVWIIRLQIEALRSAAVGPATEFTVPPPYQPMQAYYELPTPPRGADGHFSA